MSTTRHRPQAGLPALEEQERQARRRLSVYRAKVYASDRRGRLRADQLRLQELDRSWRLAWERLRRARRRGSA